MKKSLLLSFVLISLFLKAQFPMHMKVLNMGSFTDASLVLPTKDNGAIFFKQSPTVMPANYFFMAKTNSAGDYVWGKSMDLLFDGWSAKARIADACLAEDSAFAIVGSSGQYGDAGNGFCIKFKANGDTLWSKKLYDSTAWLTPKSITLSHDSGLLISGYRQLFNSNNTCGFFAKVSSQGQLLWLKVNQSGIGEQMISIKSTSDSGFVIAGKTAINSASYAALYKCNNTGQIQWSKYYTGSNSAQDIAVENDGFVLLTAKSNIELLKVDLTGIFIWKQHYLQTTGFANEFERNNRLQKVNTGDYLLNSITNYQQAIIVGHNGFVKWAANTTGPYHSRLSVQLQNKSFYHLATPYNVITATTDSIIYGATGIIITDSLGTGSSRCYATFAVASQATTDVATSFTTSLIMAGQIKNKFIDIELVPDVAKNGCLGIPGGVKEQSAFQIKYYPNPVNDILTFEAQELLGHVVSIELTDILNKTVFADTFTINSDNTELDFSALSAGTYFFHLKSGSDIVASGKIIIVK